MPTRRPAAQTIPAASSWVLLMCSICNLPAGSSDLVSITREKGNFQWRESKHAMFAGRDGDRYVGKTQWFFHCRPRFESTVVSQQTKGSTFQTTVRVNSVKMKLSLTVKTDCPPEEKVRDHERGHAEICRRIYARHAESAAKGSCQSAIGKLFSGSGATRAEAVEEARKAAAMFVCAQYAEKTANLADDVNRAYDEITKNGRNSLSAARGVDAAFVRSAKRLRYGKISPMKP